MEGRNGSPAGEPREVGSIGRMRRRVREALRKTFRSLGSRNFRLYFAGQLVSVTGTWMHAVAVAWLVLRLTGSGVALGVEMALAFGPMLLFGAWGGVLADRVDKRRLLIAAQMVLAVLALVLWGLTATDVVTLWMVYVVSFLGGVVNAIDNPTRQAFYVEMVGREDLPNAVSLNSAVFTGTRIVGPALAGVLITAFDVAPVFLINGLSYLAVFTGLLAMREAELRRTPPVRRGRGQLRAGVLYVWSTPELRIPLLVMAAVFTFSFNFTVLLPLMAERVFEGDAGTFGGLLSAMGLGSFAGALAAANRVRQGIRGLGVWGVALGLASVLVGLAPTLTLEFVLLVPLGITAITFMITGNSTLQLTAVPEMRGRVMALYSVVFLGSTPIGAPLAGWMAEWLGARWSLAFGGLVASVVGVLALSRSRRVAEVPTVEPAGADAEARPAASPAPTGPVPEGRRVPGFVTGGSLRLGPGDRRRRAGD